MSPGGSVTIIGAGIAGLVAAHVLSRRGWEVTVFEGSQVPGGKLASWTDAEGDPVEHGVHFWLDQYRNLNRILGEANVHDVFCELTPGFDLIYTNGHRLMVTPRHLGTPAGLLELVARLPGLSRLERISGLMGCLRMGACTWAAREQFDRVSVLSWALQHGFSPSFIARFLEPVVGGVLFTPLRELSMAAAICGRHAIQPRTARIRWLRGTLAACLMEPFLAHLRRQGCRVLVHHRVVELEEREGKVDSVRVRQPGEREFIHRSDWYISAMNVSGLRRLVNGPWLRDPILRGVHRLREHPVITGRFWFHRPIDLGPVTNGHIIGHGLDAFLMFVVVSATQQAAGRPELVLEVQMGPAEPYMHWVDGDLTALLLAELVKAFPELQGVVPRKVVLSRFPEGFTAFLVGSGRHRPGVATSAPNLFLAGDWLHCDFPCLGMERATVTGLQAANQILTAVGQVPEEIVKPELDWAIRPVEAAIRAWSGVRRTVASRAGRT